MRKGASRRSSISRPSSAHAQPQLPIQKQRNEVEPDPKNPVQSLDSVTYSDKIRPFPRINPKPIARTRDGKPR